jgi:hypothetical protein
MASLKGGSLAGTVTLVCYGVTLLPILVPYVVTGYFFRDVPDLLRTSWVGIIVLPGTVVSFGAALALSKGPTQVVLSIYCGITMAALLVRMLWELHCGVDCNLEIALRPRRVSRTLNRVTETPGQDYGFRGAVIFQRYNDRWRCWSMHTVLWWPGVRWCVLMFALHVNNCTKGRPHLSIDRFNWFLSEVCFPPTGKEPSVWDRPIQELMLY